MSALEITAPEILVKRARDETALTDFGPNGWQDGLERFVSAAQVDIGADSAAIAILERTVMVRLVNRLRIERWYAEHAGEATQPVQGPVIIVGLPRTATTALHYLLAVDPQFRYQRRWEVAEPVPPPLLAEESEDPRRLSARGTPSAQHISTADGPSEDGPVLALDFHHQELGFPLPTYTRWWRTSNATSTYAYHDRVLRLLQAHRPPYRWLLKAPLYCFHLPEIAAQYPNAKFLMTHRDPVTVFASVCSVVRQSQHNIVPTHRSDTAELGRFQLEHWVEASKQAMAARDAIGEHRFHDVSQQDVEAQPIATVERIYDFLGLELSDDVRSQMQVWSAQNQRGSHGQHDYTAEEFGYRAEAIRLAFSDYLERFGDVIRS
jgi:hypothetical protein